MSDLNQISKADPTDEYQEVGLLDLAIVLAKYKRMVLGLPVATGVVALVIALMLPKVYTAAARILPPQQSQSTAVLALGALGGGGGGGSSFAQALGLKTPGDLYIGLLKSRTIADRMIERFSLKDLYMTDTMVSTRNTLQSATSITSGKDGLITIEVNDRDPQRSADLANAYVEELDRLMQGLAVSEAAQRRLFFERELKATRENLARAELALRTVQEKTGIIHLDGQAKAIFEAFTELRARMAVKEVEIASMRIFSTDTNPDLVRARQELSSLRSQLSKLEKAQGAQAEGDILVPTGKVPEAGLEYLRRVRDLKYQETLFELLAKQFELAKIDESKDARVIQILDRGVAPDYKSKPKRVQIVILAMLSAGVLSVILAFVLDAIQRTKSNPEGLRRLETLRSYLRSP
jgi:tyrosine-protein kinase Etk/Wzc